MLMNENDRPDLSAASALNGPAPPAGANRDPRQDVAYGPGGQATPDAALIAYTGHPLAQPAYDEEGEAIGHAR